MCVCVCVCVVVAFCWRPGQFALGSLPVAAVCLRALHLRVFVLGHIYAGSYEWLHRPSVPVCTVFLTRVLRFKRMRCPTNSSTEQTLSSLTREGALSLA